jgi:uncharacterized protein YcfL
MKVTYFLIVILLTGCAGNMQKENTKYQVVLNNSDVTGNISENDKLSFENELYDILKNTTEKLRVFYSDERIAELKENEKYFEIIYDQDKVITSDSLGNFSIRRMLIPLSGELYGSKEDPVITVFIGDEEGYFAGPLRNKNGLDSIERMINLLK